MKLRRRQKRKQDTALDAIASAANVWAGWQLGKRTAKSVAKAKELRPPSKAKCLRSRKWVKIGGAAAVAGGVAAAVRRKLKRDEPEVYTGPPPSVAADAAVPSPDTAPPLTVAPDPATQERDTETVGGASALRSNRDDAVDGMSAEKPSTDLLELAGDAGAEPPDAMAEPPDAAAEPPDASEADELATFTRSATMDGQDGATDDDEPAKAEADDDDSGPAKAEAEGDDDSEPAETEAEK